MQRLFASLRFLFYVFAYLGRLLTTFLFSFFVFSFLSISRAFFARGLDTLCGLLRGPSQLSYRGLGDMGQFSRLSNRAYTLFSVKIASDLVVPSSKAGTVPIDLEQSTGMERLELLEKMEGADIFDKRPFDASRLGTTENLVLIRSAVGEQYASITGVAADSHVVTWLGGSGE